MTTARLILVMEASRNAELRQAVSRGRGALEVAVTTTLARLGAPDPPTAAAALMVCVEGLILHRIVRHDQTDPRPAIALVLEGAIPQSQPAETPLASHDH